MIKKLPGETDLVGRGEWRIRFNADGEVITVELWQHGDDGRTTSYEALKVVPMSKAAV